MTRNRATARAAGTKWETAIVAALVDHGWPHAERRRLAGALDRGDIAGVPGVVIEAKNTKSYDPAGALTEATREAANDNAPIAAAWIKRHGKTSATEGLVVISGATFMQLLKEAGY
ncbi:hypothetical protein NOK12_16850 [Nocardioides sp. OK12]|uniref:hypothetical protein n=1 Tax=Nocardioides sp. OK12 TaxID=2758661 RepID=UPI0021C2877B|nr:hypothetical protein [Nocardioides sp. OK12]GHJ59167.1 hypothetical protein NOK12_16850 [Nocardioides sp. OK12]